MQSLASIQWPARNTKALVVSVGELDLFFSYRTIMGFALPGMGRVFRENVWGPTTGRHLNEWGSDKSDRIAGDAFEAELSEALSRANRKDGTP